MILTVEYSDEHTTRNTTQSESTTVIPGVSWPHVFLDELTDHLGIRAGSWLRNIIFLRDRVRCHAAIGTCSVDSYVSEVVVRWLWLWLWPWPSPRQCNLRSTCFRPDDTQRLSVGPELHVLVAFQHQSVPRLQIQVFTTRRNRYTTWQSNNTHSCSCQVADGEYGEEWFQTVGLLEKKVLESIRLTIRVSRKFKIFRHNFNHWIYQASKIIRISV